MTELEQLEEDVRQLQDLLRRGRSPRDALAEFRRNLSDLNLRDLFAAFAMQHYIDRTPEEGGSATADTVARRAYVQADAMLKAR